MDETIKYSETPSIQQGYVDNMPIAELRRLLNDRISNASTSINPWDVSGMGAIANTELFGLARLALDRRILQAIDSNSGKIRLYATDEVMKHANRFSNALQHNANIPVEIREIGPYSNLNYTLESLGRIASADFFETPHLVNITNGAKPLSQRLGQEAVDAGSSTVRIEERTMSLFHEHGTKGVAEIDYLQTNWNRLGAKGLFGLLGFHYNEKLSGNVIIRFDSEVFTTQGVGPKDKLEAEVASIISASSSFEYASFNNQLNFFENKLGNFEHDVVMIKNGRLLIIEVKNPTSDDNLANHLRKADRQFSAIRERTNFADYIIVIPKPSNQMANSIGDPGKKNSANYTINQLTAKTHGLKPPIQILSPEELDAFINS